ncbi:DNA-binding transcriptional regulator, LysR family [Nocardia farcinica]|uniref:HTH-type transcriptional regulator gltC n=1 Tax=Nocardia farcinica TaxID=37329 RepID=A0A0H5NUM8_NOCFR|nr:LysR family transcriptional regulator [Nocardia farcinica]AXK88884.1 LysR family transcriptional regulator [Nocardia farcinica]PFX03983.1 HTH-type transcriptional regulator GltC [Nocardia farcinica]PFX10141.1 HTH-type transcriptional regulator GltC [Nocardia farcinica]CRY73731.1 HTH-type transcriptional regulator gltC [Nocardia farcinica]SIT24668.1 DNA-binding transcriptional regulator, LysR family [Nocardia farcinica]
MELRHLHYFLAVAEEGNFTRAAERVHVAQSGISTHIKSLERELGQQLFVRKPRGVTLTAAGAALLPHAVQVLDAVAAGRASVEALSGLLTGHVAIGTITSISPRSIDLPELLASFHRRHPGVGISLVEDTAAILAHRVYDNDLDIAFTSLTDEPVAGMRSRPLRSERMVAALPPGDPLARRRRLPLSALSGRSLIALPEGSGLRRRLDQTLAREGVRAQVAFEASDPDVLVALAGKGLGLALVPESALVGDGRVVGVEVDGLPRGHLGMLWRDGRGGAPAARAFVEHIAQLVTPAGAG